MIRCELVEPADINLVALVRHNLSLGASITMEFSSAGEVVASRTADAWPAIWPSEELPFSRNNWFFGTFSESERANFPPIFFNVGDSIFCDSISIYIDDTTNPAGYIEAARLIVADAWQPAYNNTPGANVAWEGIGEWVQYAAGNEVGRQIEPRRAVRFALDHLQKDEGWTRCFDLQRELARCGEVFVSLTPGSQYAMHNSFLGRGRVFTGLDLNILEYATQIEIVESL